MICIMCLGRLVGGQRVGDDDDDDVDDDDDGWCPPAPRSGGGDARQWRWSPLTHLQSRELRTGDH